MWLERLERTLKRSESGQFREWLKSNACREVIVERCINFHGPEILAVLSKLIPEEVAAAKLTPPSRRRRTLLAALIGICGGLLTMQLLGWMPWSTSVGASSRFEGAFSTPLDVRRQVNLPDGSVITLNTATLMYVNFGVSERAVTLVRGEASFELKADANHPFRLRIGRRLLQTEASEFVMHRLSREEVAFTIISGAVTVQHELAGTPMTPAQQCDTSSYVSGNTTLQASEGGIIGLGWQTVRRLEHSEIEARLGWRPRRWSGCVSGQFRTAARRSMRGFAVISQGTESFRDEGHIRRFAYLRKHRRRVGYHRCRKS